MISKNCHPERPMIFKEEDICCEGSQYLNNLKCNEL